MLMTEGLDTHLPVELEDANVELVQAIALLRAIDEGEMFGAMPSDPSSRKRHETGVTLLAMIQPRLEKALRKLRALG